MNKKFFIWLGAASVIIAGLYMNAVWNGSLENQPSPNQPTQNQPASSDKSQVQVAPEFTLTDLKGNPVSLSDYQGKNVYINFWASWCGPCRAEMPDIEEIHREYQDQDLVVLTINLGESKNTVEKYIRENNFTFSVLLDSDMKVGKLYKVTSIPVSVFINKDGVIVSKRVGMMTKEQMEEQIALLSK